MALNEDFLQYVTDQLAEFGEVEVKRMFGGAGLFKDGVMFGKVGGDTFRLKVDDTNKKDYEERGMKPFYSESKKKGMPYWEVPEDILSDSSKLAEWAGRSFDIAIKNK